ncbi:conserved hypothetical protein [Actinomyces sp. oral taxon 180 str. F0310]|nr:conserved hypothetical protein [Actinomyces sp. oral taxon 180 str. F0310]
MCKILETDELSTFPQSPICFCCTTRDIEKINKRATMHKHL